MSFVKETVEHGRERKNRDWSCERLANSEVDSDVNAFWLIALKGIQGELQSKVKHYQPEYKQ